jgi:hypothetical protein
MGLVSLVFYGASAVGPVATAALAEATGSRSLPVAVSAAVVGSAALVVRSSD